MKICYSPKSFRKSSMDIIEQAGKIISEYSEQGLKVTLRQLYYQFVSRDLIPNEQKEYKRLGCIINDARLCGLIDWEAIEDRTRSVYMNSHWDNGADIIDSAVLGFAMDKWVGQKYRVEVWVEKEALAGVFEIVCRQLDVPSFACRGYVSQSEMWVAGQRIRRYALDGAQSVILHFGDHDPSGIDMTRDIQERLSMFVAGGVDMDKMDFNSDEDPIFKYEDECKLPIVKRVALNMGQIEQYNPPPNPAKDTDTRFSNYRDKFGDESWELDALDPKTLQQLIRSNVLQYRDDPLWFEREHIESKERRVLEKIGNNWNKICDFVLATNSESGNNAS